MKQSQSLILLNKKTFENIVWNNKQMLQAFFALPTLVSFHPKKSSFVSENSFNWESLIIERLNKNPTNVDLLPITTFSHTKNI